MIKNIVQPGGGVTGEKQEPRDATEPSERYSVLVADDDGITRAILRRNLENKGYIVETAEDGGIALAKIRAQHYPILITDWNMPELSGEELCKLVRELYPTRYTYIVMITAETAPDYLVKGLEAGADDFLRKPFNRAELFARLTTGCRVLDLERNLKDAYNRIEALSRVDAMTGCLNRRHMKQMLGRELERAVRYKRPLSLIICDIDHFKKVNDTHGHPAGDEVIRRFAEILKRNARKEVDWVARYGGEEFLLVLPETDLAGALAMGERLRADAEAETTVYEGVEIKITASFGVSNYCPNASEPAPNQKQLVEHADQGLYSCKRGGRNQVQGVVWTPEALSQS